jgi:hypothetical protein
MPWQDNVGGRVVPSSEAGTQAAKERDRNWASSSSGGGWSGNSGNSGYTPGPSGQTGGCFPAGTMISTPSGSVDIAAVRRGDLVYSVDPQGRVRIPRQVLRTIRRSDRQIWCLTLVGGHQIRTTATHSMRVGTQWIQACAVRPDDEVVVCDDGGRLGAGVVELSKPAGIVVDVYTLTVEGEFTFVADGFVVHCFTRFRRMRVFAWSVAAALATLRSPVLSPTRA